MKLLFFQWNAFMQKGIENALRRKNIEYTVCRYILKDWDNDDEFVDNFYKRVTEGGYDTVFSVNFVPLIADVCNRLGVHYVSWVYDCPLHFRRKETLEYNCNDIYFFDRKQAEHHLNKGVAGAHYLPLAVDTDVFETKASAALASDGFIPPDSYKCDVSLLGQLYNSDYNYLCTPLDGYYRGYLEGCLASQMKLPCGYIFDELITDRLMECLNEYYKKATDNKFTVSKEELEYAMCCEATSRDRYMALALLQSRCSVRLYSTDRNAGLDKVQFMGYADYYTQMPGIFAESRVNLNISLKAIKSGIPLRVLDIMGSGGFVISDMREEAFDYFTPGTDIVMYENMQDLVEKVKYYTEHDDERQTIIKNGLDKVKDAFSFDERVGKLLGC